MRALAALSPHSRGTVQTKAVTAASAPKRFRPDHLPARRASCSRLIQGGRGTAEDDRREPRDRSRPRRGVRSSTRGVLRSLPVPTKTDVKESCRWKEEYDQIPENHKRYRAAAGEGRTSNAERRAADIGSTGTSAVRPVCQKTALRATWRAGPASLANVAYMLSFLRRRTTAAHWSATAQGSGDSCLEQGERRAARDAADAARAGIVRLEQEPHESAAEPIASETGSMMPQEPSFDEGQADSPRRH